MPITQIDPKTALIVIDIQKGIVASVPAAHPLKEVLEKIGRLTRAFRTAGLPVVLVNVAGLAPGRTDSKFTFQFPADFSELAPELEQQSSDITVTKHGWGAFGRTDLHQRLQELGVTQVVIVGVATSIGVESAARTAFDWGYHVVLVTDAMTDRDLNSHNHSLTKIFPRLGETTTTDELLEALAAKV